MDVQFQVDDGLCIGCGMRRGLSPFAMNDLRGVIALNYFEILVGLGVLQEHHVGYMLVFGRSDVV